MEARDAFLVLGLAFAVAIGSVTSRRGAALPVMILGWAAWAARLYGRDTGMVRTIQAIIVAWCALAWALNSELVPFYRRSTASVMLLIHLATVITSAVISGEITLDWTADGAAALFVLSHLPVTSAAWCGIEVGVLLTAAWLNNINDVVQHLTWWSLLVLAAFDAFVALDAIGDAQSRKLLVGPLRVVTYTVAIGVISMSIMGCSLLKDALTDNTAGIYVIGNFAMHYYPAIRAIFATSSPFDRYTATRAVAFVAAYAILHDAPAVYGCDYISPQVLPIALSGVATVAAFVA